MKKQSKTVMAMRWTNFSNTHTARSHCNCENYTESTPNPGVGCVELTSVVCLSSIQLTPRLGVGVIHSPSNLDVIASLTIYVRVWYTFSTSEIETMHYCSCLLKIYFIPSLIKTQLVQWIISFQIISWFQFFVLDIERIYGL